MTPIANEHTAVAAPARQVVLLRGLFRGQFHWGEFPSQLQQVMPECHVRCVDIPGTGSLAHLTSPDCVEDMVDSIRQQLDGQAPIDVVAISMGGMIALKWLERYPHEVRRAVCINTSAAGFSPCYQRLKPAALVRIIGALMLPVTVRERCVYRLVSNQPNRPEVVRHWAQLQRRYPTRISNFIRQLSAAASFRIKRITAPVLFISSQHDRLVSPLATQAIAKKWKATLRINSCDGHDIALDNPDWLCREIRAWLLHSSGLLKTPSIQNKEEP